MPASANFPLQNSCQKLTGIFQRAISQRNPAQWLYKTDARSELFLAESQARILAAALKSKKMEKAFKTFKKLEDILGKIDDYNSLAKLFAGHKGVRKEEVSYFIKKRNKAIDKLNDRLIKKEFYQDVFYKIYKGAAIDFDDKKIHAQLHRQLLEEMNKCFRFYSLFANGFTDMEGQVHELRRKLRWFSIYGRSFEGSIVLEKNKIHRHWEEKFISKKGLSSSYNKLPPGKGLKLHLMFDQKAFYAMNAVIAILGDIKNRGLAIEELAAAISKNRGISAKEAEAMAMKQLRTGYSVTSLLQEAHILLAGFFDVYAIHRQLIR